MFKLFYFDPETLHETGYPFVIALETEQECNQKAFEDGKFYFRIEQEHVFGSCIIYETETFFNN